MSELFNANELRRFITRELEKDAEQMKETKKMLSNAYGSNGLYFGQYPIDSVRVLQDQYVYLRVRYSVLTDIYESLFGEEYVNEEVEVESKHSDFSDLLYAIRDALRIIKCYEDCDYDKYCTSEGDGNIRDCIEELQYVENELKKMEEE